MICKIEIKLVSAINQNHFQQQYYYILSQLKPIVLNILIVDYMHLL
jgi:hypothetical protein